MRLIKLSKVQKALEKENEAKKVLTPVDFFQQGLYGKSFREGHDYLEENIVTLSELYTAALVGGKREPTEGYDVILPTQKTKEVKFRAGSDPTPTVSANVGCVSAAEVGKKVAEELFVWFYNPTTCEMDLFVVPRSVYFPGGFTVRYNPRKGEYTSACAPYRVDREKYSPNMVYAIALANEARSGKRILVDGVSEAELSEFTRNLIYSLERGYLGLGQAAAQG